MMWLLTDRGKPYCIAHTEEAGMLQRRRWVHSEKARYYQVDLVQDLLGDWTLVLCWGGLGSRRGGMRILAVTSEAAGQDLIEAIAKRRRQRGYVPVADAVGSLAEVCIRVYGGH